MENNRTKEEDSTWMKKCRGEKKVLIGPGCLTVWVWLSLWGLMGAFHTRKAPVAVTVLPNVFRASASGLSVPRVVPWTALRVALRHRAWKEEARRGPAEVCQGVLDGEPSHHERLGTGLESMFRSRTSRSFGMAPRPTFVSFARSRLPMVFPDAAVLLQA